MTVRSTLNIYSFIHSFISISKWLMLTSQDKILNLDGVYLQRTTCIIGTQILAVLSDCTHKKREKNHNFLTDRLFRIENLELV